MMVKIWWLRKELILPNREELWAVCTARPRTGFGEPRYRALFAVAVASDEVASPITRCELGRTPLNAKRPIDRATVAALHPELVCRVQAELIGHDDAGDPGDPDGDGQAVFDELDRLDPALDITEVDALLVLDDVVDADGPGQPAGVGELGG